MLWLVELLQEQNNGCDAGENMTTVELVRHVLRSEAGRRGPVSAMARVVTWQLWRRVMRRPMEFSTVTGTRLMLVPGASDSLSGYWYHQLPDFEELMFGLHLVRAGELFIDVGANQGGWSLVLAGRGASVIALEPVPVTRERLEANVARNPVAVRERVRIVPAGLGERNEMAWFTVHLDSTNHQTGEGTDGSGTRVQLRRMDDVLSCERPCLIKIDVEGAELNVLRAAGDTLQRDSLLALVVETFRPRDHATPKLREMETLLSEHGFAPCAYDPWSRSIVELRDPAAGGQNTIYVRNLPEVASRLKTAIPVRAFGASI
jgi:FkbM family methyltransferase